jgi:hypothetical protein
MISIDDSDSQVPFTVSPFYPDPLLPGALQRDFEPMLGDSSGYGFCHIVGDGSVLKKLRFNLDIQSG